MSVYTDLTTTFNFKDLLTWQNMDLLGENDAYLNVLVPPFYRRPVLQFINVTTVDIENNTGTLNQTTIVFPDGTIRSVTENTSSTNKYRRFDITAVANFTSGTEDSGIRSGITEATNTWYAIYAVKSTINTANFVLAGDTTLPLQANFSTLNSRYGTNAWVYLGMIRNGDNSGATGDILNFVQCGNRTIFTNTATGNAANTVGIRFATTASATTVIYTYSGGTGTTDTPNNLTQTIYIVNTAVVAQLVAAFDMTSAFRLFQLPGDRGLSMQIAIAAPSSSLLVSNGGPTAIAQDIFLSGFFDNALGVGSNPLL